MNSENGGPGAIGTEGTHAVDSESTIRAEGTENPGKSSNKGMIAAGCIGCAVLALCALLLVAVIPVGVIAAIAIPNFITMQLRAKRAEAPTNLDGIRTAEKAYHAEWDTFTSAGPSPATTPGRNQVAFTPTGQWSLLGWTADGKVRCKYEVTNIPGTSSQSDNFFGRATCDVDGDGREAIYECNRAERSKMMTPNNVY